MHVRGVAYLAREGLMQQEFGAERWSTLIDSLKPRLPFLGAKVLPVSRIPVGEFLALNDAIVRTFYKGNDEIYWRFGEQSGEYALTNQLKGLFQKNEARKFLQFTPQIWKSYFDGGELTCELAPQHIDIRIVGVPVKHVYFEYSVIGFARGGLALLGAPKPTPSRLKGFSAGDNEVLYRFAAPA
jgi:hypothetical protein